ncbi:Uncharacterised protein [Enterococcus durans]|uniref:Uncharacterized protein n=1 Tax=Enterococcus durans ATCC 6056 TaxID=1140001 RepID=A0ABP2UXD7_9ENTE|nr:hypothetical protein OMS_02645 [Enterococcus durans ATCC 6056]STP40285.1 Uncharacterised protein [Enterococcus durans]
MSNTLFVLLVFFEISEKNDFWMPFTRESVAKLIFRFVPHSFL